MPHAVRRPPRECGFTLIEAAIATVVLVAVVASLIPVMRRREHQRLQGLADTAPWAVFDFRAAPAKESFSSREGIAVRCEIENVTNYPLAVTLVRNRFALTLGDTDYFAGISGEEIALLSLATPKTAIAPGESLRFDVLFHPIGVGASEVRVVAWNGMASRYFSHPVEIHNGARIHSYTAISGILMATEDRFQSNAFRLVVEAAGDTELPAFEEIVADFAGKASVANQ